MSADIALTAQYSRETAPSPELLLADEQSSCSNFPLLTPSPPPEMFHHPLAMSSTTDLGSFDRALSPSSIDTQLSSIPALSHTTIVQDGNANTRHTDKDGLCNTRSSLQSGLASSSSSSSVLQDATASATLLNPHHYLAGDPICQENGGLKPVLCGLNLGFRKSPQDFSFVAWNWPLIRRFCFWTVMSLMVACVCIVITYVTTLPTRCDPPRAWYQGGLIYEIFPASFQDSNDDGIGDLEGILSRISYLESLGVHGIKLSYIFPSEHYPEHFHNPENLTKLEPTLGTMKDFHSLVASLHERNISLIIDIPLHPTFSELPIVDEWTRHWKSLESSKHVIVNNHILNNSLNRSHGWGVGRGVVTEIMDFWLQSGVDGFSLRGLEYFVTDSKFVSQIQEWRKLVDSFEENDKVLICSYDVLKSLQASTEENRAKISTILTHFNLVEIGINPFQNGTESIKEQMDSVLKGDLYSGSGHPWPMWSVGGMKSSRLTTLAHGNTSLAAILVTMMLPGSASVFYGDEIGLEDISDVEHERSELHHAHQLGAMRWDEVYKSGKGFTQRNVLPWLVPLPAARTAATSHKLVAAMSVLRDTNPGIYMHAIWRDRFLVPNAAIRYVDSSLVVVERTYPRRHSYVIIANLGHQTAVRDLSAIYYGGSVVLDQHGRRGQYMTFNALTVYPGEALLIRLDN